MPNKIIATLNHKIQKLDNEKLERDLTIRKEDFSRYPKKISFIDDIKIILAMGAQSIRKELYKYFNYDLNTITSSGFVESRAKIKAKTFKELLDLINNAYPCKKTYKEYRLIACDGSNISIYPDSNDFETYVNSTSGKGKGYNQLHLNALYDILNNRYLDVVIQSYRQQNEFAALIEMAERHKDKRSIFVCDRGYVSFNLFEHINHTGNYFLIRAKDITSKTNIVKSFEDIPKGGEFDIDVFKILTNRQTNEIKKDKRYHIMMSNQKFDFLNKENHFYKVNYRIVRIKINGNKDKYESIITNLPRDKFSTVDIKELYKLRWCIETSFRHLKYSVGLNALHSKRKDFIRQEILARLVMFNIASIVIENIKIKKLNKKYDYKVNVTLAIFLIKEQYLKTKGLPPPSLVEIIASNILPIRKGRRFKRNIKAQGFVPFSYRF